MLTRSPLPSRQGCEFTENLIVKIKAVIPEAKIEHELGDEGEFEFFVNDKIVWSRSHLGHFPDENEMVEVAFWANKGKSYMHMYLCTVAEGGEPNMIVTDRRNTPLAKRVILSCTIS